MPLELSEAIPPGGHTHPRTLSGVPLTALSGTTTLSLIVWMPSAGLANDAVLLTCSASKPS
jgi:hypothetical protein